jgi:anti-sigma factor RsiW
MVNSCRHTITAASYVLGVLCPQESAEFGRHAETCPHCRREIAELGPVTQALAAVKSASCG